MSSHQRRPGWPGARGAWPRIGHEKRASSDSTASTTEGGPAPPPGKREARAGRRGRPTSTRSRNPHAAPRSGRLVVAIPVLLGAFLALPPRVAAGDASTVLWQEHFGHAPLGWADPVSHGAAELARVYTVRNEGGSSYLHAHHDATGPSAPPALHYGWVFHRDAPELDKVAALKWRWRVTRHPSLTESQDAWTDVAAAVYVVIHEPGLLHGARGFKFGWLSKPAPAGERQRGLLEESVRTDAAGPAWYAESVDLCALYQREYALPCRGEHVLYIGVTSDADGSRSVAEADYADFELDAVPSSVTGTHG